MFAVVVISGKQYKISPGQVIEVDRLAGKTGETVIFDQVLLVSDDKSAKVGTPKVSGFKVTAKILSQEKGEKIEIRRFKSKVRYRRHKGFRPQITRLEIIAIARP